MQDHSTAFLDRTPDRSDDPRGQSEVVAIGLHCNRHCGMSAAAKPRSSTATLEVTPKRISRLVCAQASYASLMVVWQLDPSAATALLDWFAAEWRLPP